MKDKTKNKFAFWWWAIGWFVLVLLVVISLSSCATKTKIEYRDRDVYHYITNTTHDTIVDLKTDSVYYEVFTRGDTVYTTKYKEVVRWRDRVKERCDTVYKDSIDVQYKEVVKEIVKYPKLYWIALGISILFIIFALIKLLKWLRMF